MRKNIIPIGLIVMICINILLLFLLFNRPPMLQKQKGDIMKHIGVKLNLNDQQKKQYFVLAEEHRNKMESLDRKQKDLLKTHFNLLKTDKNDSTYSQTRLTQLSDLEKEKITITYSHFEDLKSILEDEQLTQFDQIIDDILRVLINEQKNPPPPRDR